MAERHDQALTKEGVQMANKHVKRHSTSLVIQETQVKTHDVCTLCTHLNN